MPKTTNPSIIIIMTTITKPASQRKQRTRPSDPVVDSLPEASVPITQAPPDPLQGESEASAPSPDPNTLNWDLISVHTTRFGPDQNGVLRAYGNNPRANDNPPIAGLTGLLLDISIAPAGVESKLGPRCYLCIDMEGARPDQVNQLRLRIGTGEKDRNWPCRTLLHGLLAGEFGYRSPLGITTRAGDSIYFVDVLQASGHAVAAQRGYWSSPEAIGHGPLDILSGVNALRRRLGREEFGSEVFGELLELPTAPEDASP